MISEFLGESRGLTGGASTVGSTRQLATLNWVWWFNEVRLHGEIGHVPPTELEANYYHHNNPQQQPLPGQPAPH